MLYLHNYNVFLKNIEGYPGLVKEFPIDSKGLSSSGGRILSLFQALNCLQGEWAEHLSIDNYSEKGYFFPYRRTRKKRKKRANRVNLGAKY
jgi:hypothetical protein